MKPSKYLALKIEKLLKTAKSTHTDDDRNNIMNETLIRRLDTELQYLALKMEANHKPRDPENTFVEKIGSMNDTSN